MSANRTQLTVPVGVLLLSLFECFQAYPELPDPMASNFGGDGVPGGWSSKRSFVIVYALSMAFWFGALLATPLLASRARQNFGDAARLWLRDTVGWFLLASLVFSAVVTHPILSGPAIKRIEESTLSEMVVTDSIPLRPDARDCAKIHVVSIAPLLGEAIRRINNEESVSSLFV